MAERARRMVEDQAAFRSANEDLRKTFGAYAVPAGETLPFLCECSDRRCFDVVRLRLDEFEAVRHDPSAFVIVPGHNDRDTEEIVSDRQDSIPDGGDRFAIVRMRAELRDSTGGANPPA